MVTILDANTIIQRYADFLGISYAAASDQIVGAPIGFSIPVTDSNIALDVTAVSAGFAGPLGDQAIVTAANDKAGTSITAGTGAAMLTVSANKTFFMTSLIVGTDAASFNAVVTDNGVAGTDKIAFRLGGTNAISVAMTFPTPIQFSTDVFIDVSVTNNIFFCVNGWEE